MSKKIFIISIMILLVLGICSVALANETYTTTSTINGVIVNWEYELNDSNQIENLRCKNPTELTGNITIPSKLDEKTVVSLASKAFNSATNITGVVIPSTITKINGEAFYNCNNLTTVDLGKITTVGPNAFKNCEKLTTITIPKTLVNGPAWPGSDGVFTGTTNLKNVTFEEGSTIIASGILNYCKGVTSVQIPNTVTRIGDYAFANSGLTGIELPNSVKEIYSKAFENCSDLVNVNLGKIELIKVDAFKNCEKLTTITIPKTLVNGPAWPGSDGVFTGTTNLKNVTFEEGSTIIASGILNYCKGVTSVQIPNTVTRIGDYAFANSGLTGIELPNSVKEIYSKAFENCSDLENVNLENVELIKTEAFANCTKLLKVTILDKCKTIAENVFKNHDEDLTIYCYEDSIAANYAIKYNIKYVYLTRPTTDDNTNNEENNNTEKPTNTIIEDNTVASGELPQTGVNMTIIFCLISITLVSIVLYKKYRDYKDIK